MIMIDTVCLLIPKDKVTMVDLSPYGVPKWNLHSKTDQYEKFVKNPSKKHKDSGVYFPRLTGYKRKSFSQDANIRIEFSVPKLIYSNNLDEVNQNDFAEILTTLHNRLSEMGVIVPKATLSKASVSSVHFSKNILLKDGYTVNYIISEINKVNLRKSFDFAKTRYINDGQSLYAHTTSHQMVIYDKLSDLNKGKKRAIDKDQTPYQKSLFEKLKTDITKSEILRIEIRLSSKQKMNKVIDGLGYEKNPTFKTIVSQKMSKDVVSFYWEKLVKEKNLGLFTVELSHKEALRCILLSNNEIKPKQAIYLFGLHTLSRDGKGMRELRTILSNKYHDRTWYRIARDTTDVSSLIAKSGLRNWVKQIDKSLEAFCAYKTELHTGK